MSTNPDDYSNDDTEFDIGADVGDPDSPEGDFAVVCTNLEKSISKSSGQPMMVWTFVGESDSGLPPGKTYLLYSSLGAKGLWKTHEVVNAMGLRDPASDPSEAVKVKKRDAIGRRVLGTFKKEQFKGKWSSKIDMVQPHPKGFGPVELSADNLPF